MAAGNKQDPLHVQWSDVRCPPELLMDHATVMEYFGQPESNPFCERDCVNLRIRQQLGRYDEDIIRYAKDFSSRIYILIHTFIQPYIHT